MILAIDIGNTNLVIGGMDEAKIYFTERISTNHTKTELEYAVDIKIILDLYHIGENEIEGCIISSVVPQITHIVKLAAEKILKDHKILVLGPGVKTGLDILLDNPAELGADRVADAVGAISQYEAPLMIIDMGTATTISVIDEKKRFIGGMIMPGVRVSLEALTSRASQLYGIGIEEPRSLIGRNTIDCMKSGIVYGTASAIDGIIDRVEEEMGCEMRVIASGGLSTGIAPHCRHEITIDSDLLLKGLLKIYRRNAERPRGAAAK